MSRVVQLHKHASHKSLGIFIATCSTSRFTLLGTGQKPDDESGDIIEKLVLEAGHRVEGRKLMSDSKSMIRNLVRKTLSSRAIDVLIITGGTGISRRDVTIETVASFLDKEVPGFGELFRKISYDEIGSAAMLSRALGGCARGKLIFCLPGSPNAVETAMKRLILPEIGHMIKVSRES